MRKTIVTVVAICTALVAGACTSATGSSAPAGTPTVAATEPAPAPSPTEPQTAEAAKAAAERELNAYAAGDWRGAWDLWTAKGKAAISRDQYHGLHTACQTITGTLFEVTAARLESPTRAVVTYTRLIVAGTADMQYEDGAWRYQPDAEAMADYAKGVDKILAKRRADGACKS